MNFFYFPVVWEANIFGEREARPQIAQASSRGPWPHVAPDEQHQGKEHLSEASVTCRGNSDWRESGTDSLDCHCGRGWPYQPLGFGDIALSLLLSYNYYLY